MNNQFKAALDRRIIPVVAIHDAGNADPLAEALINGGLPSAEITFRTDAAEDSIRAMARRGDIIVGAGTVLSVEQAKKALDAGACFIVAPGLNPKVVRFCLDRNVPVIPGVATPTDIEAAMDMGLTVLKFFPAEAFGGLKTLKAMSAPYRAVTFVPTGGLNAHNVKDYLNFSKVVAVGGSWIVKSDAIADGKFHEITRLTQEAVDIVEAS